MPRHLTADSPYLPIASLVREHVVERPHDRALDDGTQTLDWKALDGLMDRIASALQREGLAPGDAIGICASTTARYAALFLGAMRAGVVVAPLSPSVTRDALAQMLSDASARLIFADAGTAALLPEGSRSIRLDDSADGGAPAFDDWIAPQGSKPGPVEVPPEHPLNIIYSSGTTGAPKGIVQSHGMRWTHVCRGAAFDYGAGTRTLLSTPLYSNTTLVVFFPTIAFGGFVHLMPKFDARSWLQIAERERITHAMLVPVQYQRLLAHPEFDRFDLSSFQVKFSTSAPFSAALKADALKRWPGRLVEFYGMTEGGGTCILDASAHPDKLHTVGRPSAGHDIRLIDEEGRQLAAGATGEVVGRSKGMMSGYHRQPDRTREVEWFDADGLRFIRTGDVGRFDDEGFLVLMDRRKDMIISGGFNIYPSDLEALLRQHPAVADAAVVGVPSEQWGETPVAFVVRRHDSGAGRGADAAALMQWHNERSGKTQRLAALHFVDELPRSSIGKVLKRELRDRLLSSSMGEKR